MKNRKSVDAMLLLKDQCTYYDNFLRIDKISNAAKDYKFLLNRGYNAITSLNLVSSRYQLSKQERLALYRSVHSDEITYKIIDKTVGPQDVSTSILVVDGYNVLITLTAALYCKQLIRGDDGFIRDVLGVFGRVKYDTVFFSAMYYLVYTLRMLNIEKIVLILDKNIKWSRSFANLMYKLLYSFIPYPLIFLAHKSDRKILSIDGIVASSDIVVLMSAKKVFDIAGYTISNYIKYFNIIDIRKIISM